MNDEWFSENQDISLNQLVFFLLNLKHLIQNERDLTFVEKKIFIF
jgi:hypothetical protein